MRKAGLHRILVPVLALLGLAALAGCTNQPDATGAVVRSAQVIAGSIRGTDKPAEAPPLTRAALDAIEGEFIEVEIEKTGSKAFLYISGERRGAAAGDEGGRLLVWRTENEVSLTTRNGVLIATRGLGGDMVSSDSLAIDASLSGRRAGHGARLQVYSALDNKPVEMNFVCDITAHGPETIVIVERRHSTERFRETCEVAGGVVVNDYWIDSRSPTIWRSRQWAGPYIGYIQIRQVTP